MDEIPTPEQNKDFDAAKAKAEFEAGVKKAGEAPTHHEIAHATYTKILEDERRIMRQFDPNGVSSPMGEFVGIELLASDVDEEGFVTWGLHPLTEQEESNLVFPLGFGLRFRDRSGTERVYDSVNARNLLDNHHSGDSYFDRYSEVLDQLENVRTRQVGEERLQQLITNLDQRRRGIHDEAAEKVMKSFQERQWPLVRFDGPRERVGPVEISQENARLFFELLAKMNVPYEDVIPVSSWDQMTPEALEGLRLKVLEKTGFDSVVRRDVHFHAEEKVGFVTYDLRLLGEGDKNFLEIEEICMDYVDQLRETSPESFYPKKRTQRE